METQVTNDERRQFSRVLFDADVLLAQEGKEFRAQLQDISLNGVLISAPPDYKLRTDIPCALQVILADSAVIAMQGR